MISNLADLPPGTDWHLMVKMSSNLADLPLDLLADLPPGTVILWSRWFQIWQIYPRSAGRSTPLVLTSHGQDEFKFGRSTPRSAGRSTPLVLTSCGQDDFKFGRSTPTSGGRSDISSCVKMSSNLADLPLDLLADLPPGTDISWSRWVQIWQIYP